MLAIALLALIHLAAALFVTNHFWRPGRIGDALVLILLTAYATFYGVPIFLGWVTGYMHTATVIVAAAVATVWAVISYRRSPGPAIVAARWRSALKATGWGEGILWIVPLSITIGLLLVGSMMPIRAWDAAVYHSLNPMRWAEDHRFILDCYGDPAIFPYTTLGETFANVKAVLPFLVLDWTGGDRGTALAQWPFMVLYITALCAVLGRMDAPRWMLPVAAIFVLASPEFMLQSVEAYADLHLASGQIAVLWAVLVVWRDGPHWRRIWPAAIAFSVIVGAKPTGLMMGGVLGLGYLAVVYTRTSGSATPARVYRTLESLIAVLIACLCIAGPWYLHSWIRFGNPIAPVEVRIGDTVIFPGEIPADISRDRLESYQGAAGLGGWWVKMTETDRRPHIASWWGGFGGHALILGLPALALFLATVWLTPRWRLYMPLIVFFALMLLATSSRNRVRFTLYEMAMYATVFVWLIGESARGFRAVLLAALMVLGVYNIGRTIPALHFRTRPPELFAFPFVTGHDGGMRRTAMPDQFGVLDYWREVVAAPGDMLALPNDQTWQPWYARPMDESATTTRVFELKPGESVDDWHAMLVNTGATHLYADINSTAFDAAFSRTDLFHLVMRRWDYPSQYRYHVIPMGEGALFEIRHARGDDSP